MKNVCVKINNVLFNLHSITNYLKSQNVNLVVVTKCLKLNTKLIESLSLSDHSIYDTRRENINILNKHGINTICDAKNFSNNPSSQIILSSFEDFNKINNFKKKIYLNFDFGDQRDGFDLKEINHLTKLLLEKRSRHLGIMSNIGCFRLKNPSKYYFDQFFKIVSHFRNVGLSVQEISFGGSNCLPYIKYLDKYQKKIRCNLRIGEAIFLGTIPAFTNQLLPLKIDNVFLESDVIKQESKNCFLSNFGYNHLEQKDIQKSEFEIIYQSAEFSLIKVNGPVKSNEANKIIIPLKYEGLSKLSIHEGTCYKPYG